VLVFDLGGGTFDVTIVQIKGTHFKALATDGDVFLGGKDWDDKLVDLVCDRFITTHQQDPRTNPASRQELSLAVEVAKKTLSERPRAKLVVNHLGTRLMVEITREEFEEKTAPLLARTKGTTEIVIRQAGLKWSEIDQILLVGGATRMPMIERMLTELSGKAPSHAVAVDEAVAHGAALYADLVLRQRANKPTNFAVTDVNSHSLGIVGTDASTGSKRCRILIPKNTPLPHAVSRYFRTLRRSQRSVAVRVVEGESDQPEHCTPVGTCAITGLPANLPQGSSVLVEYAYQGNGRLRVTANLKDHPVGVTTEFQRNNSLPEDVIEVWTEYVASETE
jgi:molecular chaperone DnaK